MRYDDIFTQEHKIFRKSVRDYVERELAPHADEWEAAGIFPRSVYERMGELGFLGINKPVEYGGSGLDYWYTVAFAEELVRCRMAGLSMSILVQTDMATPIIAELGTDEQKREFMAPALRGEKIAALGVSEPDAGSDVASIRTKAVKDGDDYVINGYKTYITNGTRADFITLAVRTGAEGFGGISLVLFPTDTKGFKVVKKLNKLGNKSSDTAEIAFEDCRIPRRYLLGNEGHGFYYIMRNFQGERLIGAIAAVAGAQRLLEATIAYCKERKAFGRPIAKFQVNRHKIVDMATELEAGRQLAYHAVDLFDHKKECTREISMAKLFCGETAVKVAHHCLQLYGGAGYMEEFDVARAFRDTRLITIGGGTSEIMKEIIGKLMGL
ncbi:MAG: acyl-CoA dehydrogenase family protein [Myxococcales bacterium]|nr:acyl-CoA dehydrogenase family protein [Myxococcales bacterium]